MPYAVGHFFGVGRPVADLPATRMVAVLGGIVFSALIVAGTCVLLLSPAVRHRVPLAALALTGPCWAFAMRNQHYHTFEGLFDVGVPLAFFALALPRLDRLLSGRVGFSVLAGIAAMPTFALSSFLMARATAADPEEVMYQRAWAADIDVVRGQVEEGKTLVVSKRIDGCSPAQRPRWKYYFTGYAIVKFSGCASDRSPATGRAKASLGKAISRRRQRAARPTLERMRPVRRSSRRRSKLGLSEGAP